MPMSGELIPALTSDPVYPAILFLGPFSLVRVLREVVASLFDEELVPALSSDSAYPAIWLLSLLGLARDY